MNQLCVVVTGSAIRATSVLRLFNDYNKLRLSDLTTNQAVGSSNLSGRAKNETAPSWGRFVFVVPSNSN